ncbi:hypothetical protein HPB50_014112 [Hyalomma asiaticum]|uniref:Uncharacterized protein n=1 Tax=Hyalomma asiaticum TaxID=266040 RepID=A0ACB7S094_HYAAI|nr:hypothetical protein HPB50_014112 [Hyalomma asiaticum]
MLPLRHTGPSCGQLSQPGQQEMRPSWPNRRGWYKGDDPHQCNPTCIVYRGPHLSSSLECTGKFVKLQQRGPRTSRPP